HVRGRDGVVTVEEREHLPRSRGDDAVRVGGVDLAPHHAVTDAHAAARAQADGHLPVRGGASLRAWQRQGEGAGEVGVVVDVVQGRQRRRAAGDETVRVGGEVVGHVDVPDYAHVLQLEAGTVNVLRELAHGGGGSRSPLHAQGLRAVGGEHLPVAADG